MGDNYVEESPLIGGGDGGGGLVVGRASVNDGKTREDDVHERDGAVPCSFQPVLVVDGGIGGGDSTITIT